MHREKTEKKEPNSPEKSLSYMSWSIKELVDVLKEIKDIIKNIEQN